MSFDDSCDKHVKVQLLLVVGVTSGLLICNLLLISINKTGYLCFMDRFDVNKSHYSLISLLNNRTCPHVPSSPHLMITIPMKVQCDRHAKIFLYLYPCKRLPRIRLWPNWEIACEYCSWYWYGWSYYRFFFLFFSQFNLHFMLHEFAIIVCICWTLA